MFAEDHRTAEELFQASLQGDYDHDAAWDAVRILQLRGTEEVFQLAVNNSMSLVPLERARGLNVLGQFGTGKPMAERPHFDECVSIAIEHLRDLDPIVVHAAAWALAHLNCENSISALILIRNNSDAEVRWAVANGLNGSERSDAIATLIELMDDVDDNVRDWATFALGTQCPADSVDIRRALRKRLDDSYEKARDEAIWGLAQRKDQQGLNILIGRLNADKRIAGDEMAARDILGLRSEAPANELREGLQKLLRDHFPR